MLQKESGGFLRGDGDFRPCVLLDFLQVAALLPDEPPHQTVVSQDLQRHLLSPETEQETDRLTMRHKASRVPWTRDGQTDNQCVYMMV